MYKAIHVYDLDGVLVDTSHRYRNKPDGTIDLEYWFKMRTEKNIAKDKLLPLAQQYVNDCLNPEIYVIICTARLYHVWDIAFIYGKLGAPNKLMMRGETLKEYHAPDAALKLRKLSRLFNLQQFKNLPRFFWEDNIKNIEATKHLFTKTFLVHSEICENA